MSRTRMVLSSSQVVTQVKVRIRNIVEMFTTSIDLPCFCVAHSPEFDLTVISDRVDEWDSGLGRRPVHIVVVPLQDILYGGERIERLKTVESRAWRALLKARDVSDAYGLIHRR